MNVLAFPTPRRPTEAEFDALKARRDAALQKMVEACAAHFKCDPADLQVHISHSPVCYCACPDGPCQHVWDGDDVTIGDNGCSVTCSRCGEMAFAHDLRCAP